MRPSLVKRMEMSNGQKTWKLTREENVCRLEVANCVLENCAEDCKFKMMRMLQTVPDFAPNIFVPNISAPNILAPNIYVRRHLVLHVLP